MGCGASTAAVAPASVEERRALPEPEPELDPHAAPEPKRLQWAAEPEAERHQPELEPEPEQWVGLRPEHRAFIVDTLFLQRYHLTDDRERLPAHVDPTAAEHFCLMEGWEKGFELRPKTNRAAQSGPSDRRCQPVRNCVSQWMADMGLGVKEELIEEKVYLDLWRRGLPLELGGMPLDLEAVCGERGLPYVYRCALGFSEDAVDRFVLAMEFTAPEEQIFRRELARLRALAESKEEEDEQEETPDLKRKKKKKKKLVSGRFLGEDPVVRRKAAEKIQARHRGNNSRRDTEAKKLARKKQT